MNCAEVKNTKEGKEKTISDGKFFCPAKSCKSQQNFESFIKGQCCDIARPMGLKDRFDEIGDSLKKIKTLSSGKKIQRT